MEHGRFMASNHRNLVASMMVAEGGLDRRRQTSLRWPHSIVLGLRQPHGLPVHHDAVSNRGRNNCVLSPRVLQ